LTLLLGCAVAAAQTTPPPTLSLATLSLDQTLRLARERAPQLAGFEAAAAAARDMAVAAEQRPDPVLKLGVDNLPVDGADRYSLTRDFMTMRRIGWMQEMPRAEKRTLRGDKFRVEGRRAQAERTMAAAQIEREAALAWIDLVYAERALQLQNALIETLTKELSAAEIAYRSARGMQVDVHAAHSALLKQRDRAYEAGRRVDAARAMLARWVGADAAAANLTETPDWNDVPPAERLVDQAQHPELYVYALQEESARTEQKLAAANARPDWSWELSYQQRGPTYSNMVSIGISVPVPWDRPQRQDRETAARGALLAQVQHQREDALRMQTAKAQAARAAHQAASARRARVVDELLSTAAQHKSAQQLAYRAGTAKLGDVLASQREELDTQLMALEIEAEQARAWADLRYFAARTPQGTAAAKDAQ
jgi:outer membrane protein TolC